MSAAPVSVFGLGDIYPVVSGGQKAAYQLYSALNRRTPCRYVFLEPGFTGFEQGVYPSGLPFFRIGGLAARSWRNSWIAPKFLYRDGPTRYILRAARTASLMRSFKGFADESPVMVIPAFPWIWALLEPCSSNKFVVFDSFNFEYQLGLDRLSAGTVDARSLAVHRELERSLSRRADLLLACSAADAASYIDVFGADRQRIHTGFKGADVAADLPARVGGSRPAALFVGSDWGPNNEAALRIAQEFAKSLPQVEFRIAGGCCRALPSGLPSNVVVLGFVDDLAAELKAATVALNPMCSGSGINMKLLEYLAVGLPVISTEFGARGLEGEALAGVKLAPVQDFPAAIESLLRDAAGMERMRARSHAYARENLDWDVIAGRFEGMIREAVQ
ncbi:MAG TPA: glycosyltransferase family 4 protein [Burkholderiaceae bacterium]|nr:glycosyltransferase family 4 protein [Burkholderiaceae bacterium]